ncbi:hypothetical protein [Hyalangium rubrum]|uniref:hypothetical protein n=1 Tax=Hyalangium rubrum TaxID=3103134 RepID=UPI002AABBDBC|nr:hypothetical protein [Hyalangium sp. s54d21]
MTLTSAPPAVAVPSLGAGAPWLFSQRQDVNLLFIPAAVALFCLWMSSFLGAADGGLSRAIGRWVSQYLLFNGTHVILTFLLILVRRDLLHTTPHQKSLLLGGSGAVFVVTLAMAWYTKEHMPLANLLLGATIYVFAAHHTLSQVKGLWALHNLRGRTAGAPPPSETERNLQKYWVPMALTLMLVRIFWVPLTSERGDFPLMDVGQAERGSLPFSTCYVLLAVWLVYAGRLASTLIATKQSGPKCFYLLGWCSIVSIALIWPGWGAVLSAGTHGLEYAFLTGRMLEPTAKEPEARLGKAAVWPAMVAAMLPLILVGVANSPFVTLVDTATQGAATDFFLRQQPMWSMGVLVGNSIVLAHYFADAFLYRFRIPKVREVTLPRIGLG